MKKRRKLKRAATPLLSEVNILYRPADTSLETRAAEAVTQAKPQKPMRIILNQDVFARLEAARVAAKGQEVSGFGFLNVEKDEAETRFIVYDIVALDVGSVGFTEIPAEKILPLMDRSDAGKMKLWWHVHPVGTDVPGRHNWSGTDEDTATKTPLGGIPELVQWSVAIVRTPKTWVGRLDRFKGGKAATRHLPVEYGVDADFIANVSALHTQYLERYRKELASLQSPFAIPTPRKRRTLLHFLVRMQAALSRLITTIGRKTG